MTTAVALVLIASALLLVPGRTPPGSTSTSTSGSGSRNGAGRSDPFPGPRATLRRAGAGPLIAAAALAAACVAALGLRPGIIAAAGCGPAAFAGLRMLQRRAVAMPVDRSVALALDLSAAALRSGRPLADALSVAAPAASPAVAAALLRVAGLLRLGAEPEQAWSAIARDGPLGAVAVAAIRSAASGLRLATGFERLAADIRSEVATAATVRAHRAGVVAMAPLGACFLPSFVCLGVVPVIVGIAKSALGVLP